MSSRLAAWLDQEDARIREVIRKHGWAIEYIGGGCCDAPGCDGGYTNEPPFAYTVGLFGLGHPELLVFSLDMHDSQGLLNTVGDQIRAGGDLIPGIEFSVGAWPPKDHRRRSAQSGGHRLHGQSLLSATAGVLSARPAAHVHR